MMSASGACRYLPAVWFDMCRAVHSLHVHRGRYGQQDACGNAEQASRVAGYLCSTWAMHAGADGLSVHLCMHAEMLKG